MERKKERPRGRGAERKRDNQEERPRDTQEKRPREKEKGKRQCTLSVEGRPSMQRPPMGNRWPRRGAVVGGREELGPVATSKSQVTI